MSENWLPIEDGVGSRLVIDGGNNERKVVAFDDRGTRKKFITHKYPHAVKQVTYDEFQRLLADSKSAGEPNSDLVEIRAARNGEGTHSSTYHLVGETAIKNGGRRVPEGTNKYVPEIQKACLAKDIVMMYGDQSNKLKNLPVFSLYPASDQNDLPKLLSDSLDGVISFIVGGQYAGRVMVSCDPKSTFLESYGGYLCANIEYRQQDDLIYRNKKASAAGSVVLDCGGGTHQIVIVDARGQITSQVSWNVGFNQVLASLNKTLRNHPELKSIFSGLTGGIPINVLQQAIKDGYIITGTRFDSDELNKKWFHQVGSTDNPQIALDIRDIVQGATDPMVNTIHTSFGIMKDAITASQATRLIFSGAGMIGIGDRVEKTLRWDKANTCYAVPGSALARDLPFANALGVLKSRIMLERKRAAGANDGT